MHGGGPQQRILLAPCCTIVLALLESWPLFVATGQYDHYMAGETLFLDVGTIL
jgi:hypothetical protein